MTDHFVAAALRSFHAKDRSAKLTKYLGEFLMGRGILLWLLGVPIPIILLLAMCSHH